jgi:hypothetical protein
LQEKHEREKKDFGFGLNVHQQADIKAKLKWYFLIGKREMWYQNFLMIKNYDWGNNIGRYNLHK